LRAFTAGAFRLHPDVIADCRALPSASQFMDVLQPNRDAMTEESMRHIATETDIATVKARVKETWMAGDDDRFSR
jgi:hypothetical protein